MSEKILKAQYEDEPIRIMGLELECAVLEDGTRVISQRGINKALKITEGGGARNLPRFLYLKALQTFISDDLRARVISPIKYVNLNGTLANGTLAEDMAEICQVWINASNAGKLKNVAQENTAQLARILQTAVGKVGWVAIVDEATGFQRVRDKDNLRQLLSYYVAKEFLPYVKTFLDVFYEEIYRLKGWGRFDPKKNKYQVVGKYTLEYVYGCLPSAVVEEVKKKTPRGKGGDYTKKLFQSLTEEVGKPHLDRALGGVIALLKASNSWDGFKRAYHRAYGEQNQQLLPLKFTTEDLELK